MGYLIITNKNGDLVWFSRMLSAKKHDWSNTSYPFSCLWCMWTTSIGSRVDILIERRPWPCLPNGSKWMTNKSFGGSTVRKAWLAVDEVPGKVVELFEENDGNFREHKSGRIWEWPEWEGQWSSPIKGADRAKGSRFADMRVSNPTRQVSKRAYCSCPISSDMPLCTCLITFGQPLAVPHPTHDLIWSKGSLFAAVLPTNFAPSSSFSLTRPAFPLGFLVVSGSTVSQSTLGPRH